jgi:predicted permease
LKGAHKLNSYFSIINQVGVLSLIMGVGLLAKRKNLINDELSRGLSAILVNIALPALVIGSFMVEFSYELLNNMIRIFTISILFHLVIILLSKIILKKYSMDKQKILGFMFIFPNSGAMGMPLVYGLYGKIGVLYLSIFLIPYQILFWTYGEGLFSNEKENINIRKYLNNPNIIAVIIGLFIFIFAIKIPFIAKEALGDIGAITMPLSMMIIGEKIGSLEFKEIILDKDVYFCSFIRLIVAPILMFIIISFFNGIPLIKNICIAAEVIPTATVSVLFCEKYNGNANLASKCILATHILSIVTIPVMLMFLRFS